MALTARAATSTAAVACLLLALAASAAGAGTPAPAPAVDCIAAASSLSDCLDYVSPGSTSNRPSKKCCGEVKAAVAQPALVDCLCSVFGSKNLPIPIDMARVLALPGACGASNAAFSKCHIAAAPIEAPSPSAGGSTTGGATASAPVPAAASSPVTTTVLVAAVVAPLLAHCYFF